MRKAISLMLVLLLASCSPGDESKDKPPGSEHPRATPQEEEKKTVEESPRRLDPVVPEPVTPLPRPEAPNWTVREDPGEETNLPESPVPEQPSSLFEFLTSMYGVRLPHSNSLLNLEGTIGASSHTVPLARGPAPGVTEFAREILISVSKKEIVVNNYKVADIVCTTDDGTACPASFDSTGVKTSYHVRASQLSTIGSGSDAFVIVPLLKQLQHFQKGRNLLLANISARAASWLMDCDVYTVAVDWEIPYLVLAQVIHTAGFADLTRMRLVVLDDNESLAYVPILSPRLDREQKSRHHLTGDDWWQAQTEKSTDGFGVAYLSYSASLHADNFLGEEKPTLPACFPSTVAWDRVTQDSEAVRLGANQILAHIGALSESHSVLLGLVASPPAVGKRPARIPIGMGSMDVDGPEADAPAAPAEGDGPPGDSTGPARHLALDGFPENRVLPPAPERTTDAVEDHGPELPLPVIDHGPETLSEPAEIEPSIEIKLHTYLYVTDENYLVASKTGSGKLVQAVSLLKTEPEKLYSYLALTAGWVVNLGAHRSVNVKQLVTTLDTVRHRCSVFSMSGKCKRWEPVLPHVYLFMAPADRFEPSPDPVAEEPAPEEKTAVAPPPGPDPEKTSSARPEEGAGTAIPESAAEPKPDVAVEKTATGPAVSKPAEPRPELP